jgi:hypothetical protein
MYFYCFAELFPASFREHFDRLRHDTRYRTEFEASVKTLGFLWYEAPKWKLTVKLLRLIRPFCEICGDRHRLESHHKTYEHFGVEVLYLDDLQTLCQDCHAAIHGKRNQHQQMKMYFPPQRELCNQNYRTHT